MDVGYIRFCVKGVAKLRGKCNKFDRGSRLPPRSNNKHKMASLYEYDEVMNVPFKAYVLKKVARLVKDTLITWNHTDSTWVGGHRESVYIHTQPGWDASAMEDFMSEQVRIIETAICSKWRDVYRFDVGFDEEGWEPDYEAPYRWCFYIRWTKPSNPFNEVADEYVRYYDETTAYDSDAE